MSEETLAWIGANRPRRILAPWRSELLQRVLRVMTVLGGIVYVPSVLLSVKHKMVGVAALDTIAIGAIFTLAIFAHAPARLRAVGATLVMYALGAGLMITVGSVSQIYLLAFSLFATLLVSNRWGFFTVILNAATMLLIGFFGIESPEMVLPRWTTGLGSWMVMSANFVFLNLLLVLALGIVIAALEAALERSSVSQQTMVKEQAQLLELNRSLAKEVSERIRTEESLRESKALLRIAGHTARIGGWGVVLGSTDVEWSDEVCLLHEMPIGTVPTLAEAIGFYAPEWREPVGKAVERCFLDGTPFDFEAEIITAKGTRLWVRGLGNAQRNEDGTIIKVQGSVQDITPQKLAEAQHRRLEIQLRQAQKMDAVGRLAGGVAHDFNNLLSVILLNAAVTLSSLEVGDPRREDMSQIIDAGNRSAELTQQLLAFARQQPIAPRVVDINEAVAQMLKMLGRLIGEDIELVWKPGRAPCLVKMDRAQVDQILANLAVNARDAISGIGKIVIETRNVSFDARYCETNAGYAPGDFVQLSVSDNGCGMDKATQAMVFEPFFTTKEVGKGTGLGLATVYGIAKQNGGFINIYSEVGQGSTFRVYLPQSIDLTAPPEEVKKPGALQRGTETVLLVEDEQSLLRLGQRLLTRLGYTVIAASTPKKALALAEGSGTIDLLVTDVIMPEMTGRDVWQALSATRPGLKCLFISGYTADVISHRGVLEDGVHFLQKPFSLESLAENVRKALGS